MTGVEPERAIELLRKLAMEFPNLEWRIVVSLWSEDDKRQIGVHSRPEGAGVSFQGIESEVATLAEARDLLARILKDEVVLVTAMEKGMPLYRGLAPADDPSVIFGDVDGKAASVKVPGVDDVVIETWSSASQETND